MKKLVCILFVFLSICNLGGCASQQDTKQYTKQDMQEASKTLFAALADENTILSERDLLLNEFVEKFSNEEYFDEVLIDSFETLSDQEIADILVFFDNRYPLRDYLRDRFTCSNKTFLEKVEFAYYLKEIGFDVNDYTFYSVPIEISQEEYNKYIQEHEETIYKDKSTGFYADSKDVSDPPGKFETDGSRTSYLGDFKIVEKYGEYLDSFYQIHTYHDDTVYFRDICLKDALKYQIEELRYANSYLFYLLTEVNLSIWKIDSSDQRALTVKLIIK